MKPLDGVVLTSVTDLAKGQTGKGRRTLFEWYHCSPYSPALRGILQSTFRTKPTAHTAYLFELSTLVHAPQGR